MENGQLHDDKLFRAVHDRLSDYEAPANGADWDAMSRSLDSLPKTSRFQWRISLNSILVIIGVVGLSAIGFAVANHSGSKQPVEQIANQTITQPQQNNSVAVSNNLPSTNSTVVNLQNGNSVAANSTIQLATNSNSPTANSNNSKIDLTGQNGKTKMNKRQKNDLYFGDQIDPKKGFIYNTQEDKSGLSTPGAISNPNVFYDVDNNGNIKTIIHKDSSSSKKALNGDSAAVRINPFLPKNDEVDGNDPEAHQ